jgi:hypothetical protein
MFVPEVCHIIVLAPSHRLLRLGLLVSDALSYVVGPMESIIPLVHTEDVRHYDLR